jgi:hypothetical protein
MAAAIDGTERTYCSGGAPFLEQNKQKVPAQGQKQLAMDKSNHLKEI